MNKRTAIVIAAVVLLFTLSGCACRHEWAEANCIAPRTCTKCEETEGEALGHTFLEADCITPKTCSVCVTTEGEALGHTFEDANCITPKTCSVCAATEGEALGHTFEDADCITPKTCTVCAATEGEALGHTFEDANCITPKTCAVCGATEGEALGHSFEEWVVGEEKMTRSCTACKVEESADIVLSANLKLAFHTMDDGFKFLYPVDWKDNTQTGHEQVNIVYEDEKGYAVAVARLHVKEGTNIQGLADTLKNAADDDGNPLGQNLILRENKKGIQVIISEAAAHGVASAMALNGNTLYVLTVSNNSIVDIAADQVIVNLRNDIMEYLHFQ